MPQLWNELISNAILRRSKYFWRGVVSLAAAGLVAIFAFSYAFTTFSHYDDEGYFLLSYRDFLRGQVPYDQLFSFYGPFSFYSAALIARFDAANVTHDNFRWALIAAWMAIASIIAGVVWRWTHQFASTVLAFLLIGFRLRGLAVGAGHPALWTILGVAAVLWVGLDWIYVPTKHRHAFWTGFVVGIIILCKINLGIFVFLATALAVALQFSGRLRTVAVGLLVTAAAGLGVLLFLAGTMTSEKYFALAYLSSLAMTIGVAIARPVKQQPSLTGLSWLVGGLGICLGAGVGIILACGTTPGALFRSLVTYPALLTKSYHNPFINATTKPSLLLSAVAVSYAVLALRWNRLTDLRALRIGQLKITAGTGLAWAFFYDQRLALTGSLLFLWLLIVDTDPMSEVEYSNRLLLALLGSLFSLQIFPMAGQQVDWATMMPITAAVVLLADGTNCIYRESYGMQLPRLNRILAGGIGAMLTLLLFVSVGRNATQRLSEWRGARSVDLPGTHWLRLPPDEANRLTDTVTELTRNCREVLTFPGLYSFSLWSGVPPMEKTRINSWPFLLPNEVRNEALPKLRQQDSECVIVSGELYQFFRQSAVSPGNDEFLSEVERTMRPIRTIQDLTLYESSQGPDTSPSSVGSVDQSQRPPRR